MSLWYPMDSRLDGHQGASLDNKHSSEPQNTSITIPHLKVKYIMIDEFLSLSLFSTGLRPALVATQPPIQWALWALSLMGNRPKCKADHSPLSSVEVQNM
jgi:hypothetical protein